MKIKPSNNLITTQAGCFRCINLVCQCGGKNNPVVSGVKVYTYEELLEMKAYPRSLIHGFVHEAEYNALLREFEENKKNQADYHASNLLKRDSDHNEIIRLKGLLAEKENKEG